MHRVLILLIAQKIHCTRTMPLCVVVAQDVSVSKVPDVKRITNLISTNIIRIGFNLLCFYSIHHVVMTIFPWFTVGPNEICESETSLTFDVKNYYTVKGSIILNATEVPPVVATQECAPGLSCDNNRCSSSKLLMSSTLT